MSLRSGSRLSTLALTTITVPALWAQPAPVPLCATCDCCCAKKPQYRNTNYLLSFTGQIAVGTQDANTYGNILSSQSVLIWNLTNQKTAPINAAWLSKIGKPAAEKSTGQYYSDPLWSATNLGDVFGLTLDNLGNIYVTATHIYSTGRNGAGGPGGIYKLSNLTGTPSIFAKLPNSNTGLGNINFDCSHNTFYVSNFENGLIYELNNLGAIISTWDHGLNLPGAVDLKGKPLSPARPVIAGFDGASHYAALGRRPWAVRVYKGRLYYSIWSQNWNPGTATGSPNGTMPTEIWSVALNSSGIAVGPERLEITLPVFPITNPTSKPFPYTQPVSDMDFGPLGTLVVAERTMTGNNSSYAHGSRALEYGWTGSAWALANPTAYQVGVPVSPNPSPIPSNSAGGVSFDLSDLGRVWVTGDALHYSIPDYTYGMQGFPKGGGSILDSILIDDDDDATDFVKTQIGDVRIPCPETGTTVTNPPVDPKSILLPPLASVTVGSWIPLQVTLATPAPEGVAVFVTLTSSDPSRVTVSPAAVLILGGTLSNPANVPKVFGISTGTATITASAFGYTPGSQDVQVGSSLVASLRANRAAAIKPSASVSARGLETDTHQVNPR